MKTMKKLVGLLLTMVMVLSMTVTAFAYDVTINNTVAGHTYEAYQIFTGDLSNPANPDEADGTTAVLSNINWGSGITEAGQKALLSFGLAEGAKHDTAAKLAASLNTSNVKAFAKEAEKYLSTTIAGSATVPAGTKDPVSYVITGLNPGYYLIKDKDNSLNGADDSYTSFILEVVENSKVNPKSSIPEVEKKVDDVNDSNTTESATNWQDSADYDIGDAVPFKLTGTLPANYSEYKAYKMVFHDTLPAGLDQPVITSVYLADATGTLVKNFAKDDYKYDPTSTGFTITFADLKTCSLKDDITNSMKIVVEYTSVLNSAATVGAAGNPNKVKLEFSNDPNYDGTGTPGTGETPEDTVIVFTFKTVINKVDPERKPLTGAEFKLEKLVNGTWTTLTTVKNDAGTTFTFTGLDDGLYRLTETETPVGFNTIDPIYFEITAKHDIISDNPALTELKAIQRKNEAGTAFAESESGLITFAPTVDTAAGQVSADVVNNRGTVLPETGGMGTTLFYVVGAILVLGAAVMLITKKRMGNAR